MVCECVWGDCGVGHVLCFGSLLFRWSTTLEEMPKTIKTRWGSNIRKQPLIMSAGGTSAFERDRKRFAHVLWTTRGTCWRRRRTAAQRPGCPGGCGHLRRRQNQPRLRGRQKKETLDFGVFCDVFTPTKWTDHREKNRQKFIYWVGRFRGKLWIWKMKPGSSRFTPWVCWCTHPSIWDCIGGTRANKNHIWGIIIELLKNLDILVMASDFSFHPPFNNY